MGTTTPLLDRIDRQRQPAPQPMAWKPRWLRTRDEELAERERRGKSRFEAVADTTGLVAL